MKIIEVPNFREHHKKKSKKKSRHHFKSAFLQIFLLINYFFKLLRQMSFFFIHSTDAFFNVQTTIIIKTKICEINNRVRIKIGPNGFIRRYLVCLQQCQSTLYQNFIFCPKSTEYLFSFLFLA